MAKRATLLILLMAMTFGVRAITVTDTLFNRSAHELDFAFGADISFVPQMEGWGTKWLDKNGRQKDILQILQRRQQQGGGRRHVQASEGERDERNDRLPLQRHVGRPRETDHSIGMDRPFRGCPGTARLRPHERCALRHQGSRSGAQVGAGGQRDKAGNAVPRWPDQPGRLGGFREVRSGGLRCRERSGLHDAGNRTSAGWS